MADSPQYYDKRGCPIYPGDLLKTFHFTGARKKKFYHYHLVIDYSHLQKDKHLRMVPISEVMKVHETQYPGCMLKGQATDGILLNCEVIQGFGPDPILSFEDRPRKRLVAKTA